MRALSTVVRRAACCAAAGLAVLVLRVPPSVAGPDIPTKFTNQGGIVNTRHNMTQRVAGINAALMDSQRNDYGEVCVYCHTPHGSSTVVDAPLWNRTASSATYTTYDTLGTSTLTQPVTAPGPNSLTCLSCHDGTLGTDSIINMPNVSPHTGAPSANYSTAQMSTQSNAFLNTWQNPGGLTANHVAIGDPNETPGSAEGCMACHSDTSIGNTVGPQATNFAVFTIGTNLTNDHPVGITFPTPGPGVSFNDPTGLQGNMRFFDEDADGEVDTNEIRIYDTGDGFEVECASCHDPHGVPSGGVGSVHNPTFLRVDNDQSAVCLTCHDT
jgi:hypothetical protein